MKVSKILYIILILFPVITACYAVININRAAGYYPVIEKYCKQHGVDPLLVVSIIKTESNFNPNAKSKKGAIGLMQLMPQTAKEVYELFSGMNDFDVGRLYEPDFNIMTGIYYIKILSALFNDNTNLVLASYNAGLGNVRKWLIQNPIIEYEPDEMPFKETKNYVTKINRIYGIIKFFYK